MARALVAAGLAVDAYCHASLAAGYDVNKGAAALSEGTLFRLEAAAASAAALLVVLVGRLLGYTVAGLVAASALGAVLLYRYVDVGRLGPLPDMYEPTWHVPDKVTAAWAEAATLLVVLVVAAARARRRGRPAPVPAGAGVDRGQP